MKALSRVCVVAALSLVFGAAAQAADVAPKPSAASPASAASSTAGRSAIVGDTAASTQDPREPVVQRTVIDDGRAVIEELRVRGQLVKVTVHPKDGAPAYDIIVGDGSRELSMEGRNNSRGATGKRVWNVLSF